ncbi:NAD-dependent epimerase/dehydratase family protein [Bifidobacterium sp. LC6]|uniref:NAD-dependent epimerase/dehydratase family protein n=1 Tax=Bifidobacterium colobi TaxID=2809026 RepID=A0ABS5UXB0_9BIFI|nr:NAD-dependent epimerase/dehydratase family protein [Bifidobacterium colobi]MBT1175737.1 NAD-dependent epimerase/dehydratase family protein [Bifidobacterium colobi]
MVEGWGTLTNIAVGSLPDSAANGVVDAEWWDGKRVLVLGASGLIGAAIVRCLASLRTNMKLNVSVCASGRNLGRLNALFDELEGVSTLQCDVTKPLNSDLHCDVVIDAASPAGPSAFSNDPVGVMDANIRGVSNALDYVKNQENGILLYISSGEVYGFVDAPHLMKENEAGFVDTLSPRSCYPSAKRAAETYCACYREQYGVDVRIARPAHIFGPGFKPDDSRLAATFFVDAFNNCDIVLRSSGMQQRTFTYIDDCVTALLAIVSNGKAGEAYNVSNAGNDVALRDFAGVIARAGGVNLRVPAEASESGAVRASSLDDYKLRGLGWSPQYTIEQGVRETFRWLHGEAVVGGE